VFTGLVADLGHVARVDTTADGVRLTVESPLARELAEGESVAVNGVCLTAVGICGERFGADVMHETLRRSSLGQVGEGSRVNLELALRADARLVTIEAAPELLRYVVEKGSIAVDGVSLTVAEVGDDAFVVSLIPETLARTNLGGAAPGTPVNLEVDILAKYVEKLVAAR